MKPLTPTITKTPARTVLTVTSFGNPNTVMAPIMGALYGTAYGTRFKVYKPQKKLMTIGKLSAYWPDAHLKPKSKWTGIWMIEVPSFVKAKDLIQKNPKIRISVKKLPAQMSAEVLYIGPYTGEAKTIRALHAFIAEQGMTIAGPHEEVYLSRPGPKAKTIIRNAVTKKKS